MRQHPSAQLLPMHTIQQSTLEPSSVVQGTGDELQQVREKLMGILEARKDQYAIADVHVGLGDADSPVGAPPAVITLRCNCKGHLL